MTKDIGYVVAMGGDKNVQKVLENADDLNIITYGMESKFDYYPGKHCVSRRFSEL